MDPSRSLAILTLTLVERDKVELTCMTPAVDICRQLGNCMVWKLQASNARSVRGRETIHFSCILFNSHYFIQSATKTKTHKI